MGGGGIPRGGGGGFFNKIAGAAANYGPLLAMSAVLLIPIIGMHTNRDQNEGGEGPSNTLDKWMDLSVQNLNTCQLANKIGYEPSQSLPASVVINQDIRHYGGNKGRVRNTGA